MDDGGRTMAVEVRERQEKREEDNLQKLGCASQLHLDQY